MLARYNTYLDTYCLWIRRQKRRSTNTGSGWKAKRAKQPRQRCIVCISHSSAGFQCRLATIRRPETSPRVVGWKPAWKGRTFPPDKYHLWVLGIVAMLTRPSSRVFPLTQGQVTKGYRRMYLSCPDFGARCGAFGAPGGVNSAPKPAPRLVFLDSRTSPVRRLFERPRASSGLSISRHVLLVSGSWACRTSSEDQDSRLLIRYKTLPKFSFRYFPSVSLHTHTYHYQLHQ